MTDLDLATVDRLLTTTRSVRARLDVARPVPRTVVEECLNLAVQAPSAADLQSWRFVVVTDPATRAELARLYRLARDHAEHGIEIEERLLAQLDEFTDRLADVPVHVLACVESDSMGGASDGTALTSLLGSIFPAVWSLQLALRSRGLGSVMTTVLLEQEAAVADLLGIPAGVRQVAFLPVAYFTGDTFKPAKRRPLAEVAFWDAWGRPAGA